MENAFLLGILAGMLDAFPFIGTGIVLMPTAFWQLVNGRFGAAILCVVIYVACMGAREFPVSYTHLDVYKRQLGEASG